MPTCIAARQSQTRGMRAIRPQQVLHGNLTDPAEAVAGPGCATAAEAAAATRATVRRAMTTQRAARQSFTRDRNAWQACPAGLATVGRTFRTVQARPSAVPVRTLSIGQARRPG